MRTATEEVMAQIWGDVLGLPDRHGVGLHDNFFDLGGHSLLATQVMSRVRQAFTVELPIRDLFDAPTVADLCQRVEAARGPSRIEAPSIRAAGPDLEAPDQAPRDAGPLSFAQERLWFLDQLAPGSAAYNLPAALGLVGVPDVTALGRVFQELTRRHEVLRTRFAPRRGRPRQIIYPPPAWFLPVVDLSWLGAAGSEAVATQLAQDEARRPFDLLRGPLLRIALLRLTPREHVLLINMHHIVSDGWSVGVLVRELTALYAAFSAGERSPLDELAIQYADFAVWQRQWLDGDNMASLLAWWKTQLAGIPVLELPTDRPRPALRSFRGARRTRTFSRALADAIRTLNRRSDATLFMSLLALFQLLLSRYSGQSDVVVGSPVANRNHREIEGLIGFFVNTLVMRTDLEALQPQGGDPTFRTLLSQVREMTLEAHAHQDLPFERLVEKLQPRRDLSRNPLFQVVFALQHAPTEALKLPGLTLRPQRLESSRTRFDLELHVEETAAGLGIGFAYDTDLFDGSTIERMSGHLQSLSEAVVAAPDQALTRLPWLTAPEHQQLLVEWNVAPSPNPRDAVVHESFEARVEHAPDAVALVDGSGRSAEQWSYGKLNIRANRLAHHLRALVEDRGPEPRVGICLEPSPEMVVGLLGILKAGGAYVPLAPSYPSERLALISEDADLGGLITDSRLRRRLPEPRERVVCLDSHAPAIAERPAVNPASGAEPDHLAYVLYTSGSTGRPKGVAVPHVAVWRLLFGSTFADLDETCSMLQAAPVAFDASTFEIWGALLHGGRLVLMEPGVPTARSLRRTITRHKIDTAWLTASLFNLVVDEDPRALAGVAQLLIGGEALSTAHVRRYREHNPDPRLVNGYGPTESTTFTCCYGVPECLDRDAGSIPIGRPIANTRVHLLDKSFAPVALGVGGELVIGGLGLARGYVASPALSAHRFLPDLFSGLPGSRLYRTGDLVRWRADGNLDFLGRLDHQVKIRGFRIEPAEIEAVLTRHPEVREALVIAQRKASIVPLRRKTSFVPLRGNLVAYVVSDEDSVPSVRELRGFLADKLPDYMVPLAFVALRELPLLPNGKVDRAALPPPEVSESRLALGSESGCVAPRDTLELELVRIWEEVLEVSSLGVSDDFFELGGHSLLAVRLLTRVEERFGKKLPLSILFEGGTVERLAGLLRREDAVPPWSHLVAIQPHGSGRPVFCVHPGGGTVLCYLELARRLGADRPVYALQARGLEEGQEPFTRVEDMAAHYVRAIKTLQPEGPYLLAGWSFGGLVAFEMAQQLLARDRQVSCLALLDAPAPGMVAREYRERTDVQLLADLFPEAVDLSSDDFHQLEAHEQLRHVVEKAGQLHLLPPDFAPDKARRLLELFRANGRAGRSYRCQAAYPGRVRLFRSSENLPELPEIARDPSLGWDEIAVGGVGVEWVGGNHQTMVREPHAEHLAQRLRIWLEESGHRYVAVHRPDRLLGQRQKA